VHRYVWVLVGRLTLALSPHRRLRDRPTTAMRSGPTWGTCLRRACRFPFFLLGFRSRPSLSSLPVLLGRAEPQVGSNYSMGFFLLSLFLPSSRVSLVHNPQGGLAGWFVYSGLGYCGVKSDMPSPRSPRRRRGLACRVSCT
jgi:hypothetical protein